jgi:EAL domain-containing protein (putative c-di-GMP-specific phosphodiesterase class I)
VSLIHQLRASTVRMLRGAPITETFGVRGLLRHHLTHVTAAIVFSTLLGAALVGLGNSTGFLLLAAFTASGVAVDLLFASTDNAMPPELGSQLVLVTWPAAFVLLGAAGWAGDHYHGEVVALVALVVSGLVALSQSARFTILWSVVATLAVTAGAGLAGSLRPETAIASGAVVVGAAFGNRLRHTIEEFLGARRRLLHEVTGVHGSENPFATAAALIDPLVRNTSLTTASVMWFTADGRTVLLAIIGRNVPSFLTPGSALPEARNEYLRTQAESGPWITGWTVQEDDSGYSRGIAGMGVDTVAYMPISHEGRIIGLLGGAIGKAEGGQVTVAEHVPILAEVADVAATALGPAIARLEERSTATQLIDLILDERQYWPVFQPVRELATDRVVGYEALSRFDAAIPTQRLFVQASLLGRGKELEIATMRAAVKAAASLPVDCWVSVNSSATLLVDTDTVASLLAPLDRPVVIELSEHDVVTDYEPIAEALRRLGPGRSLAVDDAGAGFASLRHILEVRPAYVKLDLGLVQGVASDLTRRALVAGFVHFARDAKFTLIAEGIEDAADLRMLKRLGVSLGQGYLLGRPERAPQKARRTAKRTARTRRVQVTQPS